MTLDSYGTCHDLCTGDPDPHTPAGRAIAARSVHACLTYLLQEVEALSNPELTNSIHSAIRAAEDVVRQQPDKRN